MLFFRYCFHYFIIYFIYFFATNYPMHFFLFDFVGLYFDVGTVLNSDTLSACTLFSVWDTFSTTLSRLTHNVRAAWRSGGLHYRSCGRQTFIFALLFPRDYCRRCAKPPVRCWHFRHSSQKVVRFTQANFSR